MQHRQFLKCFRTLPEAERFNGTFFLNHFSLSKYHIHLLFLLQSCKGLYSASSGHSYILKLYFRDDILALSTLEAILLLTFT